MKFVKTVQLKTLEEVLKVNGVSKVETGIVLTNFILSFSLFV